MKSGQEQFEIEKVSNEKDLVVIVDKSMTHIRVIGNFNEILILNPSSFVGHITQVN